MIKKFYILFVLALFVGLASCEKEIIRPICDKGEHDTYFEDYSDDNGENPGTTRANESGDPNVNNGNGGITDPDEDEDFDKDEEDNITDPDEDEDYDDDEGITDPDEDEDYDDDDDEDSGK